MASSIKRLGAAALAGAAVCLLAATPAFGQFRISPAFSFRGGAPLNQNFFNLAVYGRALQNFPPYAFPYNAPAFPFGRSPAIPPFGGPVVMPPPYAPPYAPYGATMTSTIPYSPGYAWPYVTSPGYETGYSPTLTGYVGGMYGGGSPGYAGYGGAGPQASPEAERLSRVLTAAGVPNDGGRLEWPVGLRVVGGPAGDELRQQIADLLQQGAGQTQAGSAKPQTAQELARSVQALRKLLLRDRDERFSLALTTYQEAERFLDRLDRAGKLLEAEGGTAGGKGKADRPGG
jgi:hypothetical protein